MNSNTEIDSIIVTYVKTTPHMMPCRYFFPTYEDDPLLCGLDDSSDDSESDRSSSAAMSMENVVVPEEILLQDSVLRDDSVLRELIT